MNQLKSNDRLRLLRQNCPHYTYLLIDTY